MIKIDNHTKVISILQNNPNATIAEINRLSGLSVRSIERIIAELKKDGKLKRLGSKKTGYWEVNG